MSSAVNRKKRDGVAKVGKAGAESHDGVGGTRCFFGDRGNGVNEHDSRDLIPSEKEPGWLSDRAGPSRSP